MMTAYSQEKLKTILMQNFRGKHVNTVLWTMWKNPRNDLARYQGQNKNGTRFVMNLKSYVACH